MSEDLWVNLTHEEYKERARRFVYVRDHYTGDAKDKAVEKAGKLTDRDTMDDAGRVTVVRDKKELYLYRRAQGESVDAYVERAALSKFPRHHAAVVDSFSGSIFAVEKKADRALDAFGDLADPDSYAYRLWRNADGTGTNYPTMYKQAAGRFTNYKRVWYLVEEDTFKWLNETSVKNWRFEDGALVELLLEEVVDGRDSIKDEYEDPGERRRWVHYHLNGYDRYRIVKKEEGEELERIEDLSGLWKFTHYDDIDGTISTIPAGYIDLPIASEPGYSMAQDANYLYNLLSDVRNLLRVANHPKLTGAVDDDQFEATALSLMRGSNLLQGPWEYISPSPENADTGYNIYKQEVRDFFVTSHQRYNDAAREVTATEARQDDQSGRQAYLVLLSGALDELENRVLFMLAQKQFPLDSTKWLDNSVERSTDFKADDSADFADRLMRRYFDGPVPVGPTGLSNVTKTIAGLDGVEVEESEIDGEIAALETEREQQEAARREISDAALQQRLDAIA